MVNSLENKIISTIIFIINPFASIFFNLYAFYKTGSKYINLLLSCAIAIIFNYMPLLYDTSSNFYYTLFLKYNKTNSSEIRLYNKLIIFGNYHGYQYMFVIFLYTTLIMYIWFAIYREITLKTHNSKNLKISFLIFLAMLCYRNIQDIQRFYVAFSLFLYAIFILEKLVYRYALFIISILFHTSLSLPIAIYSLLNIKKNNRRINLKNIVIICLVFIFIKSQDLIRSLVLPLKFINSQMFDKAIRYTSSGDAWTEVVLNKLPLKLAVYKMSLIIMILIIYFFMLKNKKLINKTELIFYEMMIIFCLIIFNYRALFERYSIITSSLGIIYFSKIILTPSKIKIKKKKLKKIILFNSLFLFFFGNFILYNTPFTKMYSIINNNQEKEIIMMKIVPYTFFQLIDIKENGYSDKMIINISDRGREKLKRKRND